MKNGISTLNSWPEKSENQDIGKKKGSVCYTRGNNLYISEEGQEKAITTEENPGIVYGSSRVHRNEFGIEKGTFWSPEEDFLAFYRMDETMVTDYPLVESSTRIATLAPTKYPMAGMTSHKVTLGVYSLKAGKTIYLQTDSPSGTDSSRRIEYLTNITWSPDQKSIFVATLNRDQNYMELNQYDAQDGHFIKTIFSEKDNEYVEPLHGPAFLPQSSSRFLWESRRDGFNHLYLCDIESGSMQQLTRGPWEIAQLIGFDSKGTIAWFMGNQGDPLSRQLFALDLKSGEYRQITQAPATHSVKMAYDGRYILDNYTSTAVSRQIELLDEKGQATEVLLESKNPLADYKLGETEIRELKNGDDVSLYCRLIKPVDFDPAKKYPVIIYVYGGPHSQLVTNTWLGGGGLFLNYLATQGYVVFTLDNRGTAARGADFEQAIFRNLGDKEVKDQMTGVRFLKSLSYVDTTRIGINGWSYGGFMTISMMLKHPEQFKVGVCGGPVTDWKYYEVMYGERYMDTPQSNPGGYEKSRLTDKAKMLNGRLLIVHGDADGTVVPQNSVVFLKNCIDEGKQVDFFLYPGHEHNVRGKDRIHLNSKIVRYFSDFL
jgi:dipeptidyl-peptidase-4